MTESHRQGRCHFTEHVHRRKKRNRLCKALQILQRTAFHFVVRDQAEDQNRPSGDNVQIRRRWIKSEQRQQTGQRGQSQNRRDEWRKSHEILAHIAAHKAFCLFDYPLNGVLALCIRPHLKAVRHKQTQPENGYKNQPGVDLGFCDGKILKRHRNRKEYAGTCDIDAVTQGSSQNLQYDSCQDRQNHH